MLTLSNNRYYPHVKFDKDVFQTWNAYKTPKKSSIVKKCDFLRVVHTMETAGLQEEISKIQGTHNIYFAGAYSIHGMGLLEQAARSGKRITDMIKKADGF